MGPDLVYVSGRQRPVGEMNGKSGNLNNVFRQLYPEGCTIPTNELLCVFDADQVWPEEHGTSYCTRPHVSLESTIIGQLWRCSSMT